MIPGRLQYSLTKLNATLLIVLSGILYGFMGFLGTKLLQAGMSVPAMLFWRFFLAAAWVFAAEGVAGKRVFTPLKNFYEYTLMARGILFYSAASALYYTASLRVGTGPAMVVFFSFPIFVALCGFMMNKSYVNRYTMFVLFSVMVGLVLLKGHGIDSMNTSGLLISLLSALFYGLYIYINRDSANLFSPDKFTAFICLGNALIFMVIASLRGEFTYPKTLETWSYALALGIFATAVPVQMFLAGMKYVNPVKASILSVLEPAVTLIVGVVMFHESITPSQTVGVIIIITSAIISQLEPKSVKQPDVY